ncbi:MAG: XRE family transcriptional regulator [Proteobacteria bacterium]|nr:XRE family transcriptional regulator [Pseudomonadota bacterium]
MPKVNPDIMRWARKTAGFSLEEAARKLGLSGDTATARLAALEAGKKDPTRPMLVKMSEKYRRPLLTFYLPKRPQASDRGQDLRTLPEAPPPGAEALLDALLRDIFARQGLVKAALEETEEDEPLAFVGSGRIAEGVDAVVDSMRATFGVNLADFRRQRTAENAFKLLRAGAEKAGVFVLLMGNLGSYHTDINARVFRGFALADPIAPFVVINENDSRAAWSFTLLHELAHLWLGQTGVSGYEGEAEVEKFCDAAAARFLLDPWELIQLGTPGATGLGAFKERIDEFANARNVSRKMVAYNLLRSSIITAATYRRLDDLFDAERAAYQIREREGGGVVDYYVVRRHRVGPALVDIVRRMIAGGTLSMTKAGRVLGVKPTSVARVVENGQRA